MTGHGSIFKPRKASGIDSSAASRLATPLSHDSSITNIVPPYKVTALELTKNEKYCVSKLPALPAALEENKGELFNAYSDHDSGYSLVINEDAIHVWSYKSTDSTPLSIQFPIERSANSLLPLAILTSPSSGTSSDPGLAIIDSSTGVVKFFESVQHAPALGLINNKSLELQLPINSHKGEYITLAENVEPAGIVVATSWKRCLLISLRDFKSKPHLSSIELISNTKSKYLSYIFGSETTNEIFDEIVSIKSGKTTNHGMTQEIFILDSSGTFTVITYQLLSANGSPFVDKKKSYTHGLTGYIQNSIEGYLPGSNLDIDFLDSWALSSHENIYIGLCYVSESYKSAQQSLILLTLRIDSTGVLLYGSHKLSHFGEASVQKPRLFLPKPGKTAFVVVDNLVIITDINVSYIEGQKATKPYYTLRWEDRVKLNPMMNIVGFGYENHSKNSNPSIILITRESGVLRIERFPETVDDSEKLSNDPLYIIKSHIEQAIFYSQSSEIDFNIPQNLSHEDDSIVQAITMIIDEIMDSSSPYLPLFLPSIADFLHLKVQLFEKLIWFSKKISATVWPKVLPLIVDALEKNDFGLQFWSQIEQFKEYSAQLKALLEESIVQSQVVNGDNSDVLRTFFSQKISSINETFTNFIEVLIEKDFSSSVLVPLVVQVSYSGIFKNEQRFLINENSEVPVRKLWIFETTLIIRMEQIFTSEFCESAPGRIQTQQWQEYMVKFCEVLYYFVTSAIAFMKADEATSEQLDEYTSWYNSRNHHWINALIKQNLIQEAISISEKYHDFASLAQVLEAEKKRISETHGDLSFEMDDLINKKYVYYFETFKYEFASKLYDYYVKNGQIQTLLLGFTNYKRYLEQYLHDNSEKTSKFSWIRYLLDSRFDEASKVLIGSASKTNEENLDDKQMKYSLAKLAIIASNADLGEHLTVAENNLVNIKSQKILFDSLIQNYGGEVQLLKFDNILKGFKNSHIPNSMAQELLSDSFEQFVTNKKLKTIDLINWLTILKSSITDDKGFALALKVAGLVEDKETRDYYTKIIWLRLFTIGDDWSISENLNSKISTDEYIKQKIHSTVLYKTLKEIHQNAELMYQLELLLAEEIKETSDSNIKTLNDVLKPILQTNLAKYDLKSWIKSILQDVKAT